VNVVIDLRGNGGGFLESAVAIADEFLPEDELIVFTKTKEVTPIKPMPQKKEF
jgi:carboxyl-terminal processing protease